MSTHNIGLDRSQTIQKQDRRQTVAESEADRMRTEGRTGGEPQQWSACHKQTTA